MFSVRSRILCFNPTWSARHSFIRQSIHTHTLIHHYRNWACLLRIGMWTTSERKAFSRMSNDDKIQWDSWRLVRCRWWLEVFQSWQLVCCEVAAGLCLEHSSSPGNDLFTQGDKAWRDELVVCETHVQQLFIFGVFIAARMFVSNNNSQDKHIVS